MSKAMGNKAQPQLSESLEQALIGKEIVLAERMLSRSAAKKREISSAKFNVEADLDERIMARMEFEWRE